MIRHADITLAPPSDLGLPFLRWRRQQEEAIGQALETKAKCLVLQLPTGAGKSGVAEALAALDSRRTIILTATKGLQDQYAEEAGFLTDIRGMANYPCLAARSSGRYARLFRGRKEVGCDEGPCRVKMACDLKDGGCLYFDQYKTAFNAKSVITSYAYWCSIRRYGRGLGTAARLICDEAHALPEQLMQACRIEIPAYEVRGRVPRTTASWRQWAAAALNSLAADEDETRKARKANLQDRLTRLNAIDPETWEWEETKSGWAFEPVIPRLLLSLLFGETTERIVFLSATVTPETLRLCGIDDVESHTFDSDFPPRNRPIYLLRTRRIDHRMSENDIDFWVHRIDQIQRDRQDRKGIIHTVSYARAEVLYRRSRYQKNFVRTVGEFRAAVPPVVLVSPSATTGYDFPDDEARYQIIAKVPFPDTRSRIAKARIQANPEYRDHVTMQTLVQTCGRPVRSKRDWAETFIVDDHARWFVRKASQFAPAWFLDTVQRLETLPPVLTIN